MNEKLSNAKEYFYQGKDIYDNVSSRVLESAKEYEFFDFIMLETLLLSIGVLIGGMFSKFSKRIRKVVVLALLVSYGYIIWRILSDLYEDIK